MHNTSWVAYNADKLKHHLINKIKVPGYNNVDLRKYIAELKKRHVFKAGLAYLIGAWVFTEVAALVLDAFSAPPYFIKTILIIIAIGFPIWLIFSWIYDLTPEGITKTKVLQSRLFQKSQKSTSGLTGQLLHL